jgi:hypothetical protein
VLLLRSPFGVFQNGDGLMKFAIVMPGLKHIHTTDVGSPRLAMVEADLAPGAIDHGTLRSGLGYIVYEHAMFVPAVQQHYFAIDRTLVAGNAVLYSFDSEGRTINLNTVLAPRWFDSVDEIEAAIVAGALKRPIISLPGEPPFWKWPQPKPDMQEFTRRVNALLAKGPIMIDDTIITTIDDKSVNGR